MKKNGFVAAVVFIVGIALFFAGCATGGGARAIAGGHLDEIGVPLGRPVRSEDGQRFYWISEGMPNGIIGAPYTAFTGARYLVVRLREIPTATITLSWGGQVDGNDSWWNPARISLTEGTPGVEWRRDERELWIELSKALADYDRFASSRFHARLFFPVWGTGDGGVFGADYILGGWLIP